MRILVPTNELNFSASLVPAYRDKGIEVHVGQPALFLRQIQFDIIHCQWPEEFLNWGWSFDKDAASNILEVLDWWHGRTRLVCTVHNLLPHMMACGEPQFLEFFYQFYSRMHAIGHFSKTSRNAVLSRFPQLSRKNHFIHGMYRYDNLRSLSVGRAESRARLGLESGDFAVGVIGALRKEDEHRLVMNGVDCADTNVKVVFGTSPRFSHRRGLKTFQKWKFDQWIARHQAVKLPPVLTDAAMVGVVEGVDALLIVRNEKQLNSGLLPLAFTFGTPVIAPDYGVFTELLSGTGNKLYPVASPEGVGKAISELSSSDLENLRRDNLKLAEHWDYSEIITRIIDAARLGQ